MTYFPLELLGETPCNTNFLFNCVITLKDTAELKESILSYDVLYNNPYLNYSFINNTFKFSGNISLSVFNQYQMQYVDKGKSDKTQEPVISSIDNIPDHKELYKITPDSRVSIDIPVVIKLQIENKVIGETPEDDTIEIINETITVKIKVLNDLTFIKNWTIDYFKNRY